MKFSFALAVLALLTAVLLCGYVYNLKSAVSENVLRLHIVGADDTEYSQSLKLCVRDRILSDFYGVFSGCDSQASALAAARASIAEIESSARDELERHGCFEKVSVEIGERKFPTKNYKSVTLPRGTYTAVNISIGEASGKNWWCVMYPPMCITEKNVELSGASLEKLKNSLSRSEFELITKKENIDIKIKFKIAEILGKYFK